jgi:predicted ATP-binding protein involved in virulence
VKVRELTVTNFRGFAGARRFQLSERFTVIAGINGRGKSSLLDGLAVLIARLLRALALSAGNGRTISTNDVHSGEQEAKLGMQANCAGIPVTFDVTYRRASRKVRARGMPSPAVRDQIRKNYGDPTREDDQAPIAVYFTTDRAGYRLPRTLPTNLPTGHGLAHHGALSNRMVDYRDFMARYRLWVLQESAELAAFNRVLGEFLDGFSDVTVEEDPLRLTVKKAEARISLQQLSDGERAFIALLGDLVRRLALANPELKDPLAGHGVVLIDELELHLHPRWQREVVEKLRTSFPNIQFIATTHSPFIIQSLRPGELITLDPEEFGEYANRSVEDIAEHVMGVEVPQKSERYLEMMKAAEEYYGLLRDAPEHAQEAEARLAELAVRFSDDPAYQALLRLERAARQGGDHAAR